MLCYRKQMHDQIIIIDEIFEYYAAKWLKGIQLLILRSPARLVEAALRRLVMMLNLDSKTIIDLLTLCVNGGIDLSFDDNILMHTAIYHGQVELVDFLIKLQHPTIDPFARNAAGLKHVIGTQKGIAIICLLHYSGYDLTFDNQQLLTCAGQDCLPTLLRLQRDSRPIFGRNV